MGRCRTRRTDDACSTIADLVILTSRELHKELCDLMLHLHLTQNGSSVICDGNLAIG